MNNLLSTIILVLPGMVAAYLARMIGPSESRPSTDFEKTAAGLLLSIPGIIISWAAIAIAEGRILSFKDFEAGILQMPFFICYIIIAFFAALLVALWWESKGRELVFKWSEKNRSGRRPAVSSESPWEQFVGSEKEAIIRIYPIDNKDSAIIGIFKASWTPGDQEKGMLLTCTDEFYAWNDWLESPIRTYVDITNKIVYELFPPSAFDDAVRRAEEHNKD